MLEYNSTSDTFMRKKFPDDDSAKSKHVAMYIPYYYYYYYY
jgi:hypothetical protein